MTGALGWTLAYMMGCSPYVSSSVIAKVDAFTRRTVNELSRFLRTIVVEPQDGMREVEV